VAHQQAVVQKYATTRPRAGGRPSTTVLGPRMFQIMTVLAVEVRWVASAVGLAQVAVVGADLLQSALQRGWTQPVSVLSPFVRVAGREVLGVVIAVFVGAYPSDQIGGENDGGIVVAAEVVVVVEVVAAAVGAVVDENWSAKAVAAVRRWADPYQNQVRTCQLRPRIVVQVWT